MTCGEQVQSVGRIGILVLDRDKMQLDTTDWQAFLVGLPDVLAATANLIRAEKDVSLRVSEQALYKLYELSRKV